MRWCLEVWISHSNFIKLSSIFSLIVVFDRNFTLSSQKSIDYSRFQKKKEEKFHPKNKQTNKQSIWKKRVEEKKKQAKIESNLFVKNFNLQNERLAFVISLVEDHHSFSFIREQTKKNPIETNELGSQCLLFRSTLFFNNQTKKDVCRCNE